jgi:hypothetical protein
MNNNAIWISVIALLVSLFNLWRALRGPKLELILGENLALSYDHKGHLVFVLGVTITNEGATLGTILRLNGSIRSPGNTDEASFAWHSFADTSDAGSLETAFTPIATVNAWVYTLVVPGMEAVVKRVVFRTSKPFKVTAGDLKITMKADTSRRVRWLRRLRRLRRVPHASEYYSLPEKGVSKLEAPKSSPPKPSVEHLHGWWFAKRRLPLHSTQDRA